MKKRIIIILGFFIMAVCFNGVVYAAEETWLYNNAVSEAKAGNYEFSFLNLHSLVRSYPFSKYQENAQFSIGVYYFNSKNYSGAVDAFVELLDKFPDSQSTVFTMAYLLKIAQARQNEQLIVDLEKTIAMFHKLSLIFRQSKEFTYTSVLQNKYKVIYYIDKVEFYKDGELFAQVSY